MNLRRIPVTGWNKCAYEAAAFDTPNEFKVAEILDQTQALQWWIRNDPPLFRIPTPAGYFEPDFLYRRGAGDESTIGILEVKGGIYWNGSDSDPRVKARSANSWVSAANEAGASPKWEFAIVLDQDVPGCSTLGQLRSNNLTP